MVSVSHLAAAMAERRRVRLEANRIDMAVLRELPHNPDALPRYVACVNAPSHPAAPSSLSAVAY